MAAITDGTNERGSQLAGAIIALLFLVVFPGLLQKLALVSPATYVLDSTRKAVLEGLPALQLWPYIWPTLLKGLVAIPLSWWVIGQAGRYANRTGKLHRTG